ncbi:hypothetical protein [Micromonospora chersina]|uniref:hypothetical protein n=1 Tax=Micromonospora chersina TaxID=47854 RepID=UPI00371380B0
MRDDDLTFVELVQRELRDVRWAEPAELRARARRRSRRSAVVAVAAVLSVVSGSAVALAAHRGAPTVVTPAEKPAAVGAEVPTGVLLTETDPSLKALPAEGDIQLGDSGLDEPVRVDGLLETCARSLGTPVTPVTSRYSRSRNLLHNLAAGQSQNAPWPVLAQDVYRVAPGAADRVFDDVDRFAARCATWQQTPAQRAGGVVHRWRVVDRDFAGDRALLLRHTESTGTTEHIVAPDQRLDVRIVVQVGDLVTVLLPQVGGTVYPTGIVPWVTDDQLRTLARAAATRLCLAANPRC